jgi:hypothetical protein
MNSIDPRDYTLPKSDIFADEYSPNTIVTSLIDLLPIDDKITPTIALEAIGRSCRHCRHYVHEGRRGGQCERLNVSVQSRWDACALSQAVFLGDPLPFLPSVRTKTPEHCGTELSPYECLQTCKIRVAVGCNR